MYDAHKMLGQTENKVQISSNLHIKCNTGSSDKNFVRDLGTRTKINSLTMLKVKFVNKIDLGDPHLAHVSLDQNDQAFLVTQVSKIRDRSKFIGYSSFFEKKNWRAKTFFQLIKGG